MDYAKKVICGSKPSLMRSHASRPVSLSLGTIALVGSAIAAALVSRQLQVNPLLLQELQFMGHKCLLVASSKEACLESSTCT